MFQTIPLDIRNKIKAHQDAINILNTGFSILYSDDPYEWLAIAQTEELNKKLKEGKQCTVDFIYRIKTTDPYGNAVLQLMPGQTSKDKKKELSKFLQDNPALATTDLPLLYQRISLFQNIHDKMKSIPLPDHPIRDTLQERHEEVQNNEYLE